MAAQIQNPVWAVSSILNSNHGALCWISSVFGRWWMAENSTEGGWENAEPEQGKREKQE